MGDVRTVLQRLGEPHPAWAEWLDDVERARAGRYVHRVDRDRFVTGVALTKQLVAEASHRAPEQVRFYRLCADCGEPHGRPRPVDEPHLSVSVSHGGGWVLAALARGPVGVDVEPVRPAVLEVVDDLWSERERASYGDRGRTDAAVATRGWVRKEAVVKALGVGLGMPLDRVDVLDDVPCLPTGSSGLVVRDLDVDGDHRAAVAVLAHQAEEGRPLRVG